MHFIFWLPLPHPPSPPTHSTPTRPSAAHLLSDVLAFLISLFAVWVSQKSPMGVYTWGYHRWELIGACMSVFLIWILTAVLCMEAVNRIQHPEPVNGPVMFITAVAGLGVNLGMMKILHQGGHHGHSHAGGGGHSHGGGGDDHDNLNVRAAFIHVVGDLVQSIGVAIAAVIIWAVPEAHIADPICTFVFSILVLFTTVGVLRSASASALNLAPPHVNLLDLTRDLLGVAGVVRVYGLHVWEYGGSGDKGRVALEVHLVTGGGGGDSGGVLAAALQVAQRHGCTHPTIQVEFPEIAGLGLKDREGASLDLYEPGSEPKSSWVWDILEAVLGMRNKLAAGGRAYVPLYKLEPPVSTHAPAAGGSGGGCSGHGHGGHGHGGHGHGGHGHGGHGHGAQVDTGTIALEVQQPTFKNIAGLSLSPRAQ